MANYKRGGGNGIALKIYAAITSILVAASAVVMGVGFGTGRGAVIGESEENGISLTSALIDPADYADYGVNALAETAGTITATVSPSNATYKTIDWSCDWENASSSWTTGKTVTDYFTITPTSEGATTATWQCLQSFGEPIIITATSQSNPDVSGTTRADYVKRISSVNASMPGVDNFTSNTSYALTPTPVYTDGTLQGEFSVTDATIDLTDGFVEAIRDEMGMYGSRFSLTEEPINFTFDSEALTVKMNLSTPNYEFITATGAEVIQSVTRQQFDVAFTACAASYENTQAVLTFDYIYTYNSETYSSGTFTVDVSFNADSLTVSVTGIDLGEDLVI